MGGRPIYKYHSERINLSKNALLGTAVHGFPTLSLSGQQETSWICLIQRAQAVRTSFTLAQPKSQNYTLIGEEMKVRQCSEVQPTRAAGPEDSLLNEEKEDGSPPYLLKNPAWAKLSHSWAKNTLP